MLPPGDSCIYLVVLRGCHAQAIAAIHLCVVPTLTFERLFAFFVLGHGRRQLLWFEVTRHPTAEWLARQITEAFPWASERRPVVETPRACSAAPALGCCGFSPMRARAVARRASVSPVPAASGPSSPGLGSHVGPKPLPARDHAIKR